MKILIPLYFKPPPQSILFSLWEANSPFFCRMSLPDMQISVVLPNGSAALRAGCSGCAAFGGGDCRVTPRGHVLDLPLIARRFSIFRPAGRAPFYAPLRGAPDVPSSAAEIAGSRPDGGFQFAALRPAGLWMRSSPAASAAERRRAFKEGHRRHLSLWDKWCPHSGCRFATPLDSP